MYKMLWLKPGDCLEDAFGVRLAVFVEEQGFSAQGEFDQTDNTAHHLVMYDMQNLPVATGRLFSDFHIPQAYHIGRVAVHKSLRGTGAGKLLMQEMEKKAAQLGAKRIVLSAQCQARIFYQKCGYTAFGEEYLDEHCPHIDMQRELEETVPAR